MADSQRNNPSARRQPTQHGVPRAPVLQPPPKPSLTTIPLPHGDYNDATSQRRARALDAQNRVLPNGLLWSPPFSSSDSRGGSSQSTRAGNSSRRTS